MKEKKKSEKKIEVDYSKIFKKTNTHRPAEPAFLDVQPFTIKPSRSGAVRLKKTKLR